MTSVTQSAPRFAREVSGGTRFKILEAWARRRVASRAWGRHVLAQQREARQAMVELVLEDA